MGPRLLFGLLYAALALAITGFAFRAALRLLP